MKVLRIVRGSDKGGVFTCEEQHIRELNKRGVTVDLVILGAGDSVDAYKRMGNKAYFLPLIDASYGASFFTIIYNMIKTHYYGVKYAYRLKNELGNIGKYELITYQVPTYIHFVGTLAKFTKSKSIWHLPNPARTFFSRNYYNFFCNKYNIIQVANSIYTKNSLGKHCVHVVYPGFDQVRISGGEPIFREKLNLGTDVPVYGIAARMHEDKAQDVVVEAFVKSEIPSAGGHLIIAGEPLDSDFAKKVQNAAGKLLHKQIHFLGGLKDMRHFYSSVDVVINGRRNVEPFGISIAEAMGSGKPVVAYQLGGPAEMIDHGINGWLVDEPTVQAYKEGLNQSFRSRKKWGEIGQSAKVSSSKFSIQESVDALMKIIEEQERVLA